VHVVRDRRDELFAAVYARPDDDAPRAVLADYLQERGDPRGELIALQLSRRIDEPPSRREVALLRDHERDWIGVIEQFTRSWHIERAFERGFLARCGISYEKSSLGELLLERPEWSTITEVSVFATRGSNVAARLLARLPALRVLHDVQVEDLPAEHASLVDLGVRYVCPAHIEMLVPVRLPALRRLRIGDCACTVAELEPLWSAPSFRQLERFEAQFREMHREIARLVELPLAELLLSRQHDPWQVRIAGAAAELELRFSVEPNRYVAPLLALIALLPPRITSVAIDSFGSDMPLEVARALARFQLPSNA
jgi:uncharacterized protein (TIGR02996 family)